MNVNDTDYVLGDHYYYQKESPKTQILLMDTHHPGMEHFEDWLRKNPKGYKKTTPFTISVGGDVFKHYDPKYYSDILNNKEIDKKIIPISLENVGYLRYCTKKKKFITWCGNIYDTEDDVIMSSKWRGETFWVAYTPEQINSLVGLVLSLCKEFNIDRKVVNHNTFMEYADMYNGIICKSNYSKLSKDINPLMDFNDLKQRIEL
jgi:hypothetical protein